MAKRNAVKRFYLNGQEVVARYPRISDSDDLLCNINSLVEEKAFISTERKQTKAKETKWLMSLLKKIKNKKAVALVVVINGRVVGLANIDNGSKDTMSHVGRFGISLIKEARGRGIGERLLMAVIAEAKKVLKIKIVILTAFVANRPAVNCYKKCGFTKIGIVKGGIKYYGKYLDRIYMVKYL